MAIACFAASVGVLKNSAGLPKQFLGLFGEPFVLKILGGRPKDGSTDMSENGKTAYQRRLRSCGCCRKCNASSSPKWIGSAENAT